MDGFLREAKSKRSLQDSASDPRPAKRHSPSSTNMKRPNMKFEYFTIEADPDSDNDRTEDWPPSIADDNNSSPLAARAGNHGFQPSHIQTDSHKSPACPGAHALGTLQMYIDTSDMEGPPADDSPPGGVAVALEAATTLTDPEGSTSPPEQGAAETMRASTNGHRSRNSAHSSAHSDASKGINLRQCSADQRETIYERGYSKMTVPLRNFKTPPECRIYPELASEIINSFAVYATFTVKILTNYDSCTQKLYLEPNRTNTCGKLQLPLQQRKHLSTFVDLQFSNIIIEVGNPFRTLFQVGLRAVHGNLDVDVTELEDIHGRHGRLQWVLRQAAERIEQDGVMGGQYGLTLRDLDLIAKEFVHMPKSEGQAWKHFVY